MVDIALRLAPGQGVVARRPASLLWSAGPDRRLVEAFAGAPDGSELQAVASATVAADFAVAPFVGLSWDGPLRVMAYGDVSVETDQPTLPMLSGAGSRTWVEHTVATAGPARVQVGGEAIDETTDLVAGTVPAGGFRLEIGAPTEVPGAPVTPTEQAERVEEAEPVGIGPDETTAVAVVEPVEPAPTTEDPARSIDPQPATVVDRHDDPFAVAPLGPPGLAAGWMERADDASPTTSDPASHDAIDPDVTLPPPAAEVLLADVRLARTSEGRGSLVDAKVCVNGHANAPTAARCAVCAELLTPGAGTTVHVPRPSLGRLLLDDGEVVHLDHELLVGRRPDVDADAARAGLRRVTTLGEKVSRSHLEVRFQGWDILVADLGSTNGTFVVPHAGGQVVALEPGRPQLIDPGAVVYFGSRSFSVLDREDDA